MSATATLVAFMRLAPIEAKLVRSVFELIATRGHRYHVAETAGEIDKAQVVFLDADNPLAIASWHALNAQRPDTIGVLICKGEPPGEAPFSIKRPVNARKLLGILGEVDIRLHPGSARAARGAPARFATALTSSVSGPSPASVLLIEDSPTARKQLELALSRYDIKVTAAETGELGLHLLSTNHFDLVFLDVMLPGADGYQICKTIKRNGLKQATPIVMLTSRSSPFDRVKGALAGCDTYLTKPVELKRLLEVLEKHLTRRATTSDKADEHALVDAPTPDPLVKA